MRARRGHKGYRGTRDVQTPQEMTGTWAQAKGSKGESHSHRKPRQTQACGTVRRDKRQRLPGGGCGRRPGGRRFAPGEELGIR